MADLVIPTDSKAALYTVCLLLAQSGDPHAELGYETQSAAFESIGAKFGVPRNTVKIIRDTFDRFTDSGRVGWENDELPPVFKVIFDQYAKTGREELCDLSLEIMSSEWEKLAQEQSDELDENFGNAATASNSPAPLTLPDLAECQRLSKERAAKIKIDQPCVPTPEVWKQILALYNAEIATDTGLVVGTSSMTIETDKGKLLTISSQEFPRCWAVRPYVLGILMFENSVDELARVLGFANRGSGRGKEEIFKRLPSETWETDLSTADVAAIKDAVKNKLTLSEIEQDRFLRFLSDSKWSGVSKTLERGDWTISAIVGAGGWLANASSRRGELSIALAKSDAFEALMQVLGLDGQTTTSTASSVSVSAIKGGENVIFYGAPGTGKSNRVEKKIGKAGKRPFRTVFHPDLQNSDFFGCLKPQMDGKKVRYGFSPGPFMKALAEAYKEPAEPVFLVIEELNRAAAAAVFGDLFLLLDRDDDGMGEYDVSFPSTESELWFEKETGAAHKALQLPSNLFIYATMNSADQGVYPIDTAFRRRWRQEYLPLDYKSGPKGDVAYVGYTTGKYHSLAWREFVKLLNGHLTSSQTMDIAEDRLLGQWFVKNKELDGNSIPEKVLLYLWDDLLRHEGRDLIFDTRSIKTYGNLTIEIARGGRILSDRFLTSLNATSDVATTEPEDTVEDAS
ncbi:AAA family ATPase [Paracoccaceae bacterium]|nr:AAA family ATPase [Paracoccaceae bacterium]